jgi:hypothetical protein
VTGETHLATDDGSAGEKGFVTEVFRRRAESVRYARVYACGPMQMFRALARITSELRLPAEFSTEAEMGCGFGVCLGCVIPAVDKPFLVSCTEGPILAPQKNRLGEAVNARLDVRLGPLALRNPILTASGTFGYGLEFSDFVDLSKLGGLCTKGLSLNPHAGTRRRGSARRPPEC